MFPRPRTRDWPSKVRVTRVLRDENERGGVETEQHLFSVPAYGDDLPAGEQFRRIGRNAARGQLRTLLFRR